MKWNDRITIARKRKGLSKTDFWRLLKVSSATATNWENGLVKSIKGENLFNVCRVLGVTEDWLLHGKGELDGQENNSEQDHTNDVVITQYKEVRGSMGGGLILQDQPGEIESMLVNEEWIRKNVRHCTSTKNLCVVTGFGDSMKGMYNPGDPLLVDIGVRTLEFDGVYFFRINNEGFIKTLQRIPGVGIRVISENKKYEAWTITKDMDFEILARVIKVWESTDF